MTQPSKPTLKSFDDIFGENGTRRKRKSSVLDFIAPVTEITDEKKSEAEAPSEITSIPIDRLIHFSKHPFRMYPEEKLHELAASIQKHGIYQPVLVRPIGDTSENRTLSQLETKLDKEYEILAGHNRTEAAKLAGLTEIPCRVIQCDDDEAVLIVTETNLKQREKLLYSEKARAYAMQIEAIKRQGKRTDLTLSQLETKLNAGKIVAESHNESRANVYRYIRLNNLVPALLRLVDEEKISFIAGVELSYLKVTEQAALKLLLDKHPKLTISIDQAAELRKACNEMELTEPIIEAILMPPKEEVQVQKKAAYKTAFSKTQKAIRKLPKEQQKKLEHVDEEQLQQVIMTAIQTYLATIGD